MGVREGRRLPKEAVVIIMTVIVSGGLIRYADDMVDHAPLPLLLLLVDGYIVGEGGSNTPLFSFLMIKYEGIIFCNYT